MGLPAGLQLHTVISMLVPAAEASVRDEEGSKGVAGGGWNGVLSDQQQQQQADTECLVECLYWPRGVGSPELQQQGGLWRRYPDDGPAVPLLVPPLVGRLLM